MPQNTTERPINKASILNVFKSLIKQLYQKSAPINLTKKPIKIITLDHK